MLVGTRIGRRSADSDHGHILVHCWRRPCVVLIWHVRWPRHGAVLVLRRHPIVRLRSIGHVICIHGVHLLRVLRHVLRWWPSARTTTAAARPVSHVDTRRSSSKASLYVLPSRQMASTHPAGLGVIWMRVPPKRATPVSNKTPRMPRVSDNVSGSTSILVESGVGSARFVRDGCERSDQ
jgi:hypothetical protein